MEDHGETHLLIWLFNNRRAEKLQQDFIANSPFIDQEVMGHQMSKMIFKQYGINRFLYVQKIELRRNNLLLMLQCHHQEIWIQRTASSLMGRNIRIQDQTQKQMLSSGVQMMELFHLDKDLMKMLRA